MTPKGMVPVEVSEGMAIFCGALLRGVGPEDAAREAGYADAAVVAPMLMRHPAVRKALSEGSAATLECEMVPLALGVTREILLDRDPKARAIRAKLALGVFDRAAKNVKDRDRADDPAAALSKLSMDELADLVQRGMAAEAQEASTIDVTPRVVRNTPQPKAESQSITDAWGLT